MDFNALWTGGGGWAQLTIWLQSPKMQNIPIFAVSNAST